MRRSAPAPPWHPITSGWSTVFLLPLAGGLVTAANLLRLGRADKAVFAVLTGLASTAIVLALWSQGPTWANRTFLTLLILSFGDAGLFLYLQGADYRAWADDHPDRGPTSAWVAAIWALLGFMLMIVIWVAWAVLLDLGGPRPR
ncbi:MAG TPA: hypothetical protein VF276_12495 [Chloroflexia bacterium]